MAIYGPEGNHETHDEHVHSTTVTASGVREPFSVAQVVSLLLGITFVVLGAVGLARAGLDELTAPRARVGPFTVTPALAIIVLAIGVLALAAASSRGAARGTLVGLGPFLIAAGIVAIIQPIEPLGWNDAVGILLLVCGSVALAAAIATPPATVSATRSVTLR